MSEHGTKKSSEVPEEAKPEGDADSARSCGIVMPISSIDGCSTEHWAEVLRILKEVAIEAGYTPMLVSDANDVGIIQKRIIQNLYGNDLVVCDVSAKNPNVMFELGLRLAFDKATIIVKDDATDYSFDTSPIEHLEYPRDLRYTKILKFRSDLKRKMIGTREKFDKDPSASTFLKEFGEFHVARLNTKVVSQDEYLVEALSEIRSEIASLRVTQMRAQDRDFRSRASVERGVAAIKTHLQATATEMGIREPYTDDEIRQMGGTLQRIREVRMACGDPETFEKALAKVIEDVALPF